MQETAVWVNPVTLSEPVCRDPKDDIVIETALATGARTIIARDEDLTVLKKPFGIYIHTPRSWLASLSRSQRRTLA